MTDLIGCEHVAQGLCQDCEREDLVQTISDLSKELNGWRLRGNLMPDSIEGLIKLRDKISAELRIVIQQERKER